MSKVVGGPAASGLTFGSIKQEVFVPSFGNVAEFFEKVYPSSLPAPSAQPQPAVTANGSENTTSAGNSVKCAKKHIMTRRTTKPRSYRSSVRCDFCHRRHIETDMYFYHCEMCQYDICMKCRPDYSTDKGITDPNNSSSSTQPLVTMGGSNPATGFQASNPWNLAGNLGIPVGMPNFAMANFHQPLPQSNGLNNCMFGSNGSMATPQNGLHPQLLAGHISNVIQNVNISNSLPAVQKNNPFTLKQIIDTFAPVKVGNEYVQNICADQKYAQLSQEEMRLGHSKATGQLDASLPSGSDVSPGDNKFSATQPPSEAASALSSSIVNNDSIMAKESTPLLSNIPLKSEVWMKIDPSDQEPVRFSLGGSSSVISGKVSAIWVKYSN